MNLQKYKEMHEAKYGEIKDLQRKDYQEALITLESKLSDLGAGDYAILKAMHIIEQAGMHAHDVNIAPHSFNAVKMGKELDRLGIEAARRGEGLRAGSAEGMHQCRMPTLEEIKDCEERRG